MLAGPSGLATGPQVRRWSFSVAVDGADQKVDAPLVDRTPLGFDPLSSSAVPALASRLRDELGTITSSQLCDNAVVDIQRTHEDAMIMVGQSIRCNFQSAIS